MRFLLLLMVAISVASGLLSAGYDSEVMHVRLRVTDCLYANIDRTKQCVSKGDVEDTISKCLQLFQQIVLHTTDLYVNSRHIWNDMGMHGGRKEEICTEDLLKFLSLALNYRA